MILGTSTGQAGAADGSSKWITSVEARLDAQRLRAENDVVIVGMGTVIADDPALDVRIDGYKGRQPRPVVVAGQREMPPDRRIMERDPIVYRPDRSPTVDPLDVMTDLGRRGIVSAMIEGGPSVAASFLNAGAVDDIVWYVGAKLAGGRGLPAIAGVFDSMSDIIDIEVTAVQRIGPDIKISATINKER
jgi:diaminohydroxyphosphoribosylaminopyrimidine deaminase/5-amino-6-(5-phosphoribosylamino)uracil reductase